MEIVVAQQHDRARIVAFYQASRYEAELGPEDLTLLAVSGPTLAGIVRVCREDGVLVLRGLQVAPAFRRRGVGRSLMAAAVEKFGAENCFALAYRHLERFYGHAGFFALSEADLPEFLAERLKRYLAEGRAVFPLCRPAQIATHAGRGN